MISRGDVNQHLRDRGMLTVEQQCEPGPLEGFMAHSSVRSLESLEQWCRMERETYLYLKSAYDIGRTRMSHTRYEEIINILSWLHQFHANVRQVIASQKVLTAARISETMDTLDNEEGHY